MAGDFEVNRRFEGTLDQSGAISQLSTRHHAFPLHPTLSKTSSREMRERCLFNVCDCWQDAMPSRPWHEVDEMLRQSLGSAFRSVFFAEIDEVPMSSASIAQVHRARLKSGEEVVIKARHKDVEKLMQNDLSNLETLCNWIAW